MPLENTSDDGRYLLQKAYDAGIRDPRELSIFMGQTEVESRGFQAREENLNYRGARLLDMFGRRLGIRTHEEAEAIAQRGPEGIANAIYGGQWGSEELGNTEPGDGWAFRGRGYIQITGRDNYTGATRRTGLDLVANPDLATTREGAAVTAIDYWQDRVVRRGAHNDVTAATRAINTGGLHLAERTEAAERWENTLTPEVLRSLSRGEVAPEARGAAPVRAQPAQGQQQPAGNNPGDVDAPGVVPQAWTDPELMQGIRGALAEAERGIGKAWDDNSERALSSLYGAAREKGFDGNGTLRVAFNQQTDRYQAGEWVFLQRTGVTASPDPAANRTHLSTSDAIAQPVGFTMARVHEQESQRTQEQLQPSASLDQEQQRTTQSQLRIG